MTPANAFHSGPEFAEEGILNTDKVETVVERW